tara:strand:- start:13706 stop:13972 length:267 start_codon:yes stop_codon:yes gene_type:complete
MTELVANEYGVEFDHIKIKKLRIFRTDGKWLVEYRRQPRWFLGIDRWWWFNDGTYVEYTDASARVDYLIALGYVNKARFQTVKEFEVE